MIDENKLEILLDSISKSDLSNGIAIIRDKDIALPKLKQKYRSFFKVLEKYLRNQQSLIKLSNTSFFDRFSADAYMRIAVSTHRDAMVVRFGSTTNYIGKYMKTVTLDEFISMITTKMVYADE